MGYIGNFPINRYSTNNSGANAINQMTQMNNQERIKQNMAREGYMRKVIQDTNYSDLVSDRNRMTTAKAVQSLEDFMTNAYMYEMDDDGSFTSKRKRFMGKPTISAKESAVMQQMAAKMAQEVGRLRMEEEQLAKAEAAYKNPKNQGVYDPEIVEANIQNYYQYGVYPEEGFLSAAPVSVHSWTRDKQFDTRPTEQRKPNVSQEGNYDVYTYPSAPEEYQMATWREQMATDEGKQKGAVKDMFVDVENGKVSMDEVKALVMGAVGYDPQTPESVYGASQQADAILGGYGNSRKYAPDLIEAATNYWEMNGAWKNIGAGSQQRKFNDARAQRRIKEAEEAAYTPTQVRDYDIQGEEVQGVDLSNTTKTKLNNFQLPTGSYKIVTEEVNSNQAKIDAKKEEVANSQGRKKRIAEREVKNLQSTGKTVKKKAKEVIDDKETGDYEVVTYGKYKGENNQVIVLKKSGKDKYGNSIPDEYIFVPMEGNEDLLSNIDKNFKKDKEEGQFKKSIGW